MHLIVGWIARIIVAAAGVKIARGLTPEERRGVATSLFMKRWTILSSDVRMHKER